MTPLLQATGLSKSFGNRLALSDVSLSLAPGELVAVLGPSGSGKTTLFRCLTRLVEPDGGSIWIEGEDLLALRGRALAAARRKIGIVFQQFNLVRRLSALDNVLAGRLADAPLWRVTLRRFGAHDVARAIEALSAVGLAGHLHQRADTLSGGQQQRVAIARAIAQGKPHPAGRRAGREPRSRDRGGDPGLAAPPCAVLRPRRALHSASAASCGALCRPPARDGGGQAAPRGPSGRRPPRCRSRRHPASLSPAAHPAKAAPVRADSLRRTASAPGDDQFSLASQVLRRAAQGNARRTSHPFVALRSQVADFPGSLCNPVFAPVRQLDYFQLHQSSRAAVTPSRHRVDEHCHL